MIRSDYDTAYAFSVQHGIGPLYCTVQSIVRQKRRTMSIKARIEDAEILWQHGRKEGAWVLALVAAAATSRKRYPRPIYDNVAFKSFIRDVLPTLMFGKPLQGTPNPRIVFDQTPVEDIIYEHIRCYLLHEGEVAQQVAFSESKIVDGKLQATLAVGSPNEIPDFWVLNLMKAVKEAPENASEFPHSDKIIEKVSRHQLIYSVLGLVLGLVSIMGGIVLFLAGVTGKMSWTTNFLSATSKLLDAAPGAVLFVVGLFMVFVTRYKLKSQR